MASFRNRKGWRQPMCIPALLLLWMALGACRVICPGEKPAEHPSYIRVAEAFAQNPAVPASRRQRAENALQKLKNGVTDAEPMLIHATLDDIGPQDSTGFLELYVIDEQRDLLGITVKERHADANGIVTVVEEDYPVFVRHEVMPTSKLTRLVVHFRTNHQRKDEVCWREYTRRISAASFGDCQNGGGRGVVWPSDGVPAIWMSIPGSKISVSVSVYDRSGNTSSAVPVEWISWLELLYDGEEHDGEERDGQPPVSDACCMSF